MKPKKRGLMATPVRRKRAVSPEEVETEVLIHKLELVLSQLRGRCQEELQKHFPQTYAEMKAAGKCQ